MELYDITLLLCKNNVFLNNFQTIDKLFERKSLFYNFLFNVMTVISGHAPKRKGKEPPIPADT